MAFSFSIQIPEQGLGTTPISSLPTLLSGRASLAVKNNSPSQSHTGPYACWDRAVGFLVTPVLVFNAV